MAKSYKVSKLTIASIVIIFSFNQSFASSEIQPVNTNTQVEGSSVSSGAGLENMGGVITPVEQSEDEVDDGYGYYDEVTTPVVGSDSDQGDEASNAGSENTAEEDSATDQGNGSTDGDDREMSCDVLLSNINVATDDANILVDELAEGQATVFDMVDYVDGFSPPYISMELKYIVQRCDRTLLPVFNYVAYIDWMTSDSDLWSSDDRDRLVDTVARSVESYPPVSTVLTAYYLSDVTLITQFMMRDGENGVFDFFEEYNEDVMSIGGMMSVLANRVNKVLSEDIHMQEY